MARYTDRDQCVSDALALCVQVRATDPWRTYRTLAQQCHRDPERMAQLLMALAAFVDPETSTTGELRRIVERIVNPTADPKATHQ